MGGSFQNLKVATRRMYVAVGLAPALLRAACEIRMTTGEKHSRGTSGSPTEKEAKQAKPSDSPTHEAENNQPEEAKPSDREIKAALAARERLYGEKSGQAASEVIIMTTDDFSGTFYLTCCFLSLPYKLLAVESPGGLSTLAHVSLTSTGKKLRSASPKRPQNLPYRIGCGSSFWKLQGIFLTLAFCLLCETVRKKKRVERHN